MIKIEVDEAFAFDMLAIAEIKFTTSDKYFEAYDSLVKEIVRELGEDQFYRVFLSDEYLNLYEANKGVFIYVERLNAEDSTINALDVHEANMLRYKYKKELQNKFFGNDLTEQKTKF